MKNPFCLLAGAIFAMGLSLPAHSIVYSPSQNALNYDYPYSDPYMATATFALLQNMQHRPQLGSIRVEGRNHFPLLEDRAEIDYTFLKQNHPAPLVVVIPGMGGSALDGSARYLQEVLFSHGFNTVAVASPFHWKFALAASRSAVPGITQNDAEDLNQVVRLVIADLQRRHGMRYTRLNLVGYSLGALEAAYMARIDESRGEFRWNKVALINPPIDLPYALGSLDHMYEGASNWPAADRQRAWDLTGGMVIAYMSKFNPTESDYFLNLKSKLHVNRSAMIYAIGRRFRETLTDTIFVVQQLTGLGHFKYSDPFDRRRMTAGRHHSYLSYFKTFVTPTWKATNGTDLHLNSVNKYGGLEAIRDFLGRAQHVYLFHNSDDMIVRNKDLKSLAKNFGARAKIYPRGGHLGNMWFKTNQADLLRILSQP